MPDLNPTWWQKNGYLRGKEIGGGLWVCLAPMIFTWRLMLCAEDFVYGFACYDKAKLDLALEAFDAWDGTGLPLGGYTRAVRLDGAEVEAG